MSDTLTFLRTKGDILAAKKITWRGDQPEIREYDNAKHFSVIEKTVQDISDFGALMTEIEKDPHVMMIRGAAVAGIDRENTQRLGPGNGSETAFEKMPHHLIMIDFDGIEGESRGVESDVAILVQKLPPEFRDVTTWWQYTGGAGIKPGVRMRLAFWGDRPTDENDLKIWLPDCVDKSIYKPNQPIYTANPVIVGRPDHIQQRSGILLGSRDAVEVPGAFEGSIKATKRTQSYKEALRLIGHQEGGAGFFSEGLPRCIGLWFRANGPDGDIVGLRGDIVKQIQRPETKTRNSDGRYKDKVIADLDRFIDNIRKRERAQRAKVGSDALDRINDGYAVVKVGATVGILSEYEDTDDIDGKTYHLFSIMKPSAFHDWLANEPPVEIQDGGEISLSRWWMHNPKRRQYVGIKFMPGRDVPGFYNPWRGFTVEPKKGDCSLFLNHLRDCVCQGDLERYRWLITRIAAMFQRPTVRYGTAIVLLGLMGTGKTVVGKHVGSLLGSHYVKVSKPEHITGRFNAHFTQCLLLQCEEAFWAGDKRAEGALKDLITSETQAIEPKFADVFMTPSFINLLVTSNEKWAVPAGVDERRFAVFDVGVEHKEDHSYFAAIEKQMDEGGREALLHHLLHEVDIDAVNLYTVPRTEALLEQKVHGLDPIKAWWLDMLHEGKLPWGYNDKENACPARILYLHFLRNTSARAHRASETQFGMTLKKIAEPKKPKKTFVIRTMIGAEIRKRGAVYFFPTLSKCRALFETELQQKIEWDDADDEEPLIPGDWQIDDPAPVDDKDAF